MATLSLKISLEGGAVTKTIQFDPQISVFDACKIIREKFAEAIQGKPSEYGLFLSDDDNKQGVWLESGRNLGYYLLRNHDVLEYRRKLRTLRVRMLDGAVKTILVDDSQPVSQLMVVICTKIGITNHEEYGLVREENDQQNENLPDNKTGTLTLRRKFAEKDRDAKMESLRKKLKTDDEIVWVDTGKTLREQGIDESETVLLKRKFFFSDQNIDSRDPVQLNLLYVQARDAILDGTHPVTQEKACEFAGIQAQIQFGDYIESKHKPGFLDLKEFLPQSNARVKNIEKKVFAEHRKHISLSELDAKVLYTKTARELPTYGVTFFLVKEKMVGKNKLVPRLLGVTKDSVLRLDEHTKEILKTWPLTTVRRWGASPNTFTLDFGDYADEYYSVQTTEAEQIVQLIAGYIDIILKKKQNKDHFGLEGDEGSTMVEESVAPSKATFLQCEENRVGKAVTESVAKPAIIRASDGERPYVHQEIQTVQYGAFIGQVNMAHQPPTLKETRINSVHSEPQRALVGYISAGREAIRIAEEELLTKAPLPDMHSIEWRESKLDTSKHAVSVHIASVNAATAQVVTATQPDDVDHEVISQAVSQITESIPEVTKEVRLLAALMDDDDNNGNKLLDTARQLCNALSDLLKAAEPESKEPRQNLLNAASRVGQASGDVLTTIGEETPENREIHDMLLGLAKAVANTTAALVLRAKSIAAECDDDEKRNRVIGSASQCALAASQLVACAKVVAPTIQNASCRGSLEAAAREVAKSVSNLVDACKFASESPQLKGDLMAAAKEVSRSLGDLLDYLKQTSNERLATDDENPVEKILITTDKLVSSVDTQEMVRQARVLGQVTAQLIQSIKSEAEQEKEPGQQHRLLAAAKKLADATAKMVEAARLCASSPHDAGHQTELRSAAEELRDITTSNSNTPAIKRKIIQRLENCAKDAASYATQCISASHNAIDYSDDFQTKEHLMQDCRIATEYIPSLVNGVKTSIVNPNDSKSQLNLIEISEQFIDAGTNVASSARAFYPTVKNHVASQTLSDSAMNLNHSINELGSAARRAREACSGQELESAIDCVKNLYNVLNDTRTAYLHKELRPLPNETSDNTSQQLTNSAKAVALALSQLISAINQDERMYAGVAGRDLALALGDFTKNIRGVVATGGNADIIDKADEVIRGTHRVMEVAQQALDNGDNGPTLHQYQRDVTNALQSCVECLPGQREVDEALKNVNELSEIINLGEYPPTDKTYGQLQNELRTAANNLNEASGEVAKAYSSPPWLAVVSQNYSVVYKDLLSCALEMAGQTTDHIAQTNIMNGLRGVSATSVSLLSTAKLIASDPHQANAKGQLSQASRTVTDSINYLVDVSTQAAPCQKECDNAIRSIEALRPLLDNPTEPINDQGYYECVENATEKSRQLGIAISDTCNQAKNADTEFGHSVNQVSEALRSLIESAAQASYLIGVSHPTSSSGRPGIIDQTQLYRAYQGIRQNCDIVSSLNTTKQQKITALTAVAKQTSILCTVCRRASLNTSNPVAKNEFIEGAKSVANTTADLVAQVKALEDEYSAPSRAQYVEPLLEAVNSMCQYASQPEFISIPAKISEEGYRAQEPILQAGRGVVNGVVEMVKAVKSLAVAPKDPAVWQQLSLRSKPVSDSVRNLVDSIRDKAPGQAQCDNVLETINTCARELDTASISIGVQGLPKRQDNNLQGFTSQMLNASAELLDKLEPIKSAAKRNAESLGHAVTEISRYIVPLTESAIGASSHIVHSNKQILLIDQTRSVVESSRELVEVAREAGGNPRATQLHSRLDEAVDNTREIILELNTTVEKLSTESGIVSGLLEQIYRAMSRITDKRQSVFNATSSTSFVDYQTRMVQSAKEIARLANEMNAKAALDPSKLAQPSVEITHHYTQLAQDSIGASHVTSSSDSAMRIKQSVQDLGRSIGSLIQASSGARVDDAYSLSEISSSARSVSEKVAQVLAALQAGSKGTQACINAANTVSGIIGDLDTTIMFATAGTLHSDNDGNFADHREHILKTAKALVEDTKVLVAGAAGSQEQLSNAAQNAVTTIIQLADAVKRGACSLGSNQPESQVMVINAVKDVASALGELINTTKTASGKSVNDPCMQDLKESARI
ncbi:talin-2 isoform X2 [Sitodiplosis mosellana]|uniref:talin-2 isoform X2 n=1 Tax=Sitodiplosis mosellana TaxID=263140 RepID=UPI0024439E01|nr:talin-2 isoform X2 [Sitodiplosis mosellana]XP_055324816.1 talin-2 isoform X2 [Sitodiplosis mosellana]XP_055324817.1 talin-2 isoform X2 [Sitodiplosis mosellana]XP_055324818.1 talin-2 isoform X2 [Sitodiplosis mosellana]XP_055324819.1 talin-2 isoform X2 [Sitodiplosis mosellana]